MWWMSTRHCPCIHRHDFCPHWQASPCRATVAAVDEAVYVVNKWSLCSRFSNWCDNSISKISLKSAAAKDLWSLDEVVLRYLDLLKATIVIKHVLTWQWCQNLFEAFWEGKKLLIKVHKNTQHWFSWSVLACNLKLGFSVIARARFFIRQHPEMINKDQVDN
jgi:hypothetical protein